MPEPDETAWAEIALDSQRRATGWPSRREMAVDLAALAVFVTGAALLLVFSRVDHRFSWLTATVLLVAYAQAARIPLEVGSGFTVPTEVVLVIALFVLPVAVVPLLALAGLLLATLTDVISGRRHPLRLVICAGDAIHVLPPAIVLAAAAPTQVTMTAWPIYLAALSSQFVVDAGLTATREWLRVRVPPLSLLGELRFLYAIDALLAPIGLLAALANRYQHGSYVLVLPIIVFARLLAAERHRRMEGLVELKRTSEIATTDPLTGALNRRGWEQRVEELMADGPGDLIVAMLDMDGLKRLNDNEGHAAGDAALAGAVSAWRSILRAGDIVARTGGDEFTIAFEGLSEDQVAAICDRLADAAPGSTSFSVGFAAARPGEPLVELIERADMRLYDIKRARHTLRV